MISYVFCHRLLSLYFIASYFRVDQKRCWKTDRSDPSIYWQNYMKTSESDRVGRIRYLISRVRNPSDIPR